MLFFTCTLFAVCLIAFPVAGVALLVLGSQLLSRGMDQFLGCR